MRPNLQKTVDLVIFTEEICNGKLHFLCSVTQAYKLTKSNNLNDWYIESKKNFSMKHATKRILYCNNKIIKHSKI